VDIPRLNRIVLAFPGTEITALQKVGRGARKFEGKDETIIYDLLDDLVRVLAKQFLRRKLWYKGANGITLGKVVKNEGKVRKGKDAQVNAKAQDGRKLRDRFRVARPGRER
jgi:superfamily II DNA or RNA helicase